MTSIINRNGVNINLDTVVNDLNGKADIDLVNLSAEGKKKISSLCRRSVLGELVQSTVPLTDPGLHLLNGAILTYDVYEDFIDYIASLYEKGTYTQLFETEANWQQSVTNYGVCGKFVYDSANNTVRLPKITGIVEGTTDVTALGDLVQAGLPNITGTINPAGLTKDGTATGALSSVEQSTYTFNSGSYTQKGLTFDASRSSSIYGNSDTVQPQTIKVLYYIVVAGVQGTGEGGGGGTAIVDVDGITITKNEDQQIQTVAVLEDNKGTAIKTWTGTKAEYDAITTKDASTIYNVTDDYTPEIPSANVERIGQIISSTIPLIDAGLHLLDGSVLQRGIYKDFVDYIAELYTSGDYTSIFDTEANWQAAVTLSGVCDKFVYDSTNNTVRLPKYGTQTLTKTSTITTASSVPVKGDGKTLGITNGTTEYGLQIGHKNSSEYWLTAGNSLAGTSAGTTDGTYANSKSSIGVTTDSTKSGIIADTSSLLNITNYPINCYYYIVVANSTKTDIQVDIDEIATDLNGKADVDLSNIADTAKIYIAHASSPSSTYETLTWGANGTTYTAPADGWFIAQARFTGAIGTHYLLLSASITNMVSRCSAYNASASTTMTDQVNLPVRKGATVYLNYGSTSGQTMDSNYIRFIYAIGSESEAS